jgi:hypothetical protein
MWFLNSGRRKGNYSIKARPNKTKGSNNQRVSTIILVKCSDLTLLSSIHLILLA